MGLNILQIAEGQALAACDTSITAARPVTCYASSVMTPVTALYGRKASQGHLNLITVIAMSAFHVGAVAALTAGLPRAGALAGLLIMPLSVPLVIFGAAATGDGESAALKLEAAVSLLIVGGAPFVTGAAIRAGRT